MLVLTDLVTLLEDLLTWALALGPSGRFVLPALGASVGLVAFALGWTLLSQRTAWRARELLRASRTALHGSEVGDRAWVLGRVRARGAQTIESFTRADRRAVVSSLHERHRGFTVCLATRSAPELVIETRSGSVPIVGMLDVRRTRATRPAKNVDERTLTLSSTPARLRAADLLDGQWILAHGTVARVTREGLREQAGVLGLKGGSRSEPGVAPVELTALRPEVPGWTLPAAIVGAVVVALVLSPIPWPNGSPLVTLESPAALHVSRAVRLLAPTRSAVVASELNDTISSVREREWAAMAALERGDCGLAAGIYFAMRRDEEALALVDRPGCDIDARARLVLLRENGRAAEAYALTQPPRDVAFVARVRVTPREAAALAAEAQLDDPPHVFRDGRSFVGWQPLLDVGCDDACLQAIRGHGEEAFDIAASRTPLRRSRLDCTSSVLVAALRELGVECSHLTPAHARDFVRLSARSVELTPLSHVEARLQLERMLLDYAGDAEEARVVEARQRRLLAVMASVGGERAEDIWADRDRIHSLESVESSLTTLLERPADDDGRGGCMPWFYDADPDAAYEEARLRQGLASEATPRAEP